MIIYLYYEELLVQSRTCVDSVYQALSQFQSGPARNKARYQHTHTDRGIKHQKMNIYHRHSGIGGTGGHQEK